MLVKVSAERREQLQQVQKAAKRRKAWLKRGLWLPTVIVIAVYICFGILADAIPALGAIYETHVEVIEIGLMIAMFVAMSIGFVCAVMLLVKSDWLKKRFLF